MAFGSKGKIIYSESKTVTLFGKEYHLKVTRVQKKTRDLDHTTNYLNSDKMEERFNFLIKSYKQEMINDRLKSLENDFG